MLARNLALQILVVSNSTTPRALAWDGTDLWMVGTTRDRLIRLNRTTGVGTELGTAGFGVGETQSIRISVGRHGFMDGRCLHVIGLFV